MHSSAIAPGTKVRRVWVLRGQPDFAIVVSASNLLVLYLSMFPLAFVAVLVFSAFAISVTRVLARLCETWGDLVTSNSWR